MVDVLGRYLKIPSDIHCKWTRSTWPLIPHPNVIMLHNPATDFVWMHAQCILGRFLCTISLQSCVPELILCCDRCAHKGYHWTTTACKLSNTCDQNLYLIALPPSDAMAAASAAKTAGCLLFFFRFRAVGRHTHATQIISHFPFIIMEEFPAWTRKEDSAAW